MFTNIRDRFNRRSWKARIILAALACSMGLTLGAGGTAVVAQIAGGNPTPGGENTPIGEQCIDALSKCAGPNVKGTLPGAVQWVCSQNPSEQGGPCYFALVSGPKENFTCGGTYPGDNCTDTTNTEKLACYVYTQGTCEYSQTGDFALLQCSGSAAYGEYRPKANSADFVETCINQ